MSKQLHTSLGKNAILLSDLRVSINDIGRFDAPPMFLREVEISK
jgi:hypothetical protein